jgi:hypothetical protein
VEGVGSGGGRGLVTNRCSTLVEVAASPTNMVNEDAGIANEDGQRTSGMLVAVGV